MDQIPNEMLRMVLENLTKEQRTGIGRVNKIFEFLRRTFLRCADCGVSCRYFVCNTCKAIREERSRKIRIYQTRATLYYHVFTFTCYNYSDFINGLI